MADIERVALHAVSGHKVETCAARDGGVLLRTPDIFPVNARDWHGPYPNVDEALLDFRRKIAVPRLTLAELNSLKRHGYYGIANGVPTILTRCLWTGATVLRPFELVDPRERSDGRV